MPPNPLEARTFGARFTLSSVRTPWKNARYAAAFQAFFDRSTKPVVKLKLQRHVTATRSYLRKRVLNNQC